MYQDMLNQTASYEAYTGVDGFGKITYAAAVSLTIRWVDKHDRFNGKDGKEIVSSAVVVSSQLLTVDSKITLTGGTIDQSGIIRAVGSYPSVDAGTILYKAWVV